MCSSVGFLDARSGIITRLASCEEHIVDDAEAFKRRAEELAAEDERLCKLDKSRKKSKHPKKRAIHGMTQILLANGNGSAVADIRRDFPEIDANLRRTFGVDAGTGKLAKKNTTELAVASGVWTCVVL